MLIDRGRILMILALVKSALSLVLTARLVTPSRMVLRPSRWCVRLALFSMLVDSNSHQTSMFVPEPVISLALKPIGTEGPNFSRALNRFQKEDPTFKVHIDHESKETIISGMGELHLEIYVERMKREYKVECTTGKPRVAFRETLAQRADFTYTHKKQTGGAGQFARVIGYIEPMEPNEDTGKDTEFESVVMSGNIPNNYIPACEKVRALRSVTENWC